MSSEAVPCPDCNGHGGGWPENPTTCGGVLCPWCNGVCETCLGLAPGSPPKADAT